MAQWVRRVRADGGESIQIKWRQDGRGQCETFTNQRAADGGVPQRGRGGLAPMARRVGERRRLGSARAGAAAKSIRHRHGLLFSIVKHGQQKMKLRADNPCLLSELPELNPATSQARQIRFFQHGEWALFRSCVRPDAQLLLNPGAVHRGVLG